MQMPRVPTATWADSVLMMANGPRPADAISTSDRQGRSILVRGRQGLPFPSPKRCLIRPLSAATTQEHRQELQAQGRAASGRDQCTSVYPQPRKQSTPQAGEPQGLQGAPHR
eukprot:scaffold587_cov109-Isochrysis_galbana.AAC.3